MQGGISSGRMLGNDGAERWGGIRAGGCYRAVGRAGRDARDMRAWGDVRGLECLGEMLEILGLGGLLSSMGLGGIGAGRGECWE